MRGSTEVILATICARSLHKDCEARGLRTRISCGGLIERVIYQETFITKLRLHLKYPNRGIVILNVMDTHAFAVLKLLMVGILVNSWMMTGLSAIENLNVESLPQRYNVALCNETQLLWEMELCGEEFKRGMTLVDPQNWCNLTHFISEYHIFSQCSETKSVNVNCFWPNPLVESYMIRIHKHFFSNCTLERVIWVDPPDDTLTILILIPIFLTLAMIALVVWCSKRSDILA
ncbi:hypothetical protein UPYG_G00072710 [Umbra pygmaea]|uniref:Receptor activity-modifying protein 3 n=1 Tax=Umbra pygmaea TaxID=75934 RepID=A0ABD0XBZ5_UMBPY